MIDTRLVLIDGISGSGKSMTAHWLARQLARNGVDARWYHEEEDGHPFRHREVPGASTEESIRAKDAFVLDAPCVWADFARGIQADPGAPRVSIVESYLFQYPFMTLIRNGWDRPRIKDFARRVADGARGLSPVLIQFRQDDVPAACRLNWSRRGDEWRAWYLDRVSKTDFARSRGLSGEQAAYALLTELHDASVELAGELGFPHLVIENSAQDWNAYKAAILRFLDVGGHPEEGLREPDLRFAGDYAATLEGETATWRVRVHEGRLVMDAFWPCMRLLPVSDDTFEMEGFPFEFRFDAGKAGESGYFEVTKSRLFLTPGMRFARVG